MTLTVSVSQLRNNISSYLEKVLSGNRVIIHDEKRGVTIAQITQAYSFDKNLYEKTLSKAAGIFLSENHPEWKSRADVIKWLTKNRLSDERSF